MKLIKKNILTLAIIAFAGIVALGFCLKEMLHPPEEKARAKVAIVIDDWGYNLNCLQFLQQIDVPLTISILPNLRYSRKIAKEARDAGKEVILHLPLEPEMEGRNLGWEQHTITQAMPEEEVIEKLKMALDSVAYARGVSNHMGSRATQNGQLMAVIFFQLKKKGLFFLDTLVTDKSVCPQLARQMQVKFTARDFYLDNLNSHAYIHQQLKKFRAFALKNKRAVGIAHAREKTLQILAEAIPLMQDEGIEFVFVSELVQ